MPNLALLPSPTDLVTCRGAETTLYCINTKLKQTAAARMIGCVPVHLYTDPVT